MKLLTEDIVKKDLAPHKKEYEKECDWWTGSNKPYKNAPYGYDVNTECDASDQPYRATVYKMKEPVHGFRETDLSTILFRFWID